MKRKGQVAVYLAMILVVICVLALLNVDTFVTVRAKNRLQNGGDAAALAAAHKQGTLINEIGRLNVDHLLAALAGDSNRCERIVLEQRRLCLLGPVEALRLANEAAKRNGLPVQEDFATILRDHVNDIRTLYADGSGEGDPYPESYPGAWTDYATALLNVVNEGLATAPDNIEFYNATAGHTLLTRAFYMAIASGDWCWFHFNDEALLHNYTSYRNWSPLPEVDRNSMENCEIFNLHVNAWKGAITDLLSTNEIQHICRTYGDGEIPQEQLAESVILTNRDQVWFLFESGRWGRWFNGLSLAGEEDGYEFPIVGEIKPEYNVRGCAAIARCIKEVESVALESTSDVAWAAGAKPFGTVENFEGETDVVTALSSFVVPCFTNVRLVPLDSVGGEDLSTADYGWVTHVRKHLPHYLQHGPVNAQGCFYCLQLQTWEKKYFRVGGIRWLKNYAGTCIRGTGGGGSHGGTSHGH